MKKKISNKNKLIIVTIINFIYLIAYVTLCYIYPQCIRDLPCTLMLIVGMSMWEYTFLNDLRWDTKKDIIFMDGDEEC